MDSPSILYLNFTYAMYDAPCGKKIMHCLYLRAFMLSMKKSIKFKKKLNTKVQHKAGNYSLLNSLGLLTGKEKSAIKV